MTSDTVDVVRRKPATGNGHGRGKRPAAKQVNLRPLIAELTVHSAGDLQVVVNFTTQAVNNQVAKPREIMELLGLDPAATRVLKRATFLAEMEGRAPSRPPLNELPIVVVTPQEK